MSHRAVHGDSTQAKAWADALQGRQADLLFTDPPYCLLTRRRKGGDARDAKGVKNEGREVRRFEDVAEYRAFTKGWMQHALANVRADRPWIIWTNLFGRAPIIAEAKACGRPHLLGEFVWGKRTRETQGEELLRVVEVALVIGTTPLEALAPDAPPLPWAAVAGYDDDGEAATFGNHPNHKPFGVLEPLVRAWSQPGELVVDPFGGSGSLPAAALKLGRNAAAIERDAEWAANVKTRLEAAAR